MYLLIPVSNLQKYELSFFIAPTIEIDKLVTSEGPKQDKL